MSTKETLVQRAKELEAEVTAKMSDAALTAAQKAEFLDKAEAENAEISTAFKNLNRAKQFRAGSDLREEPGTPEDQKQDPHLKSVQDAYSRVKSAAAAHNRDSVSFELGLKTQGVTGMMGESTSGTTAPSALSGYFLAGSAGAGITPEFIPGITALQFYPNVIASLFPSMPVSSPVVSYVKESAWTNNAAAVLEGATKPTSTNAVTRLTEQLGKIAHLARVTDELVQDAPYFWSLIQQRLAQGVVRKEEIELLAGSGYPGVNGLLNRTTGFTKPNAQTAVTNLVIPGSSIPGVGAGTDTVASVTPGRAVVGTGSSGTAPTGVQIAEGILQAITDIRTLQFFEPDAVLMNPADWMTVRTAKDGQGQYLGGSFFGTNYGNGQAVGNQAIDAGISLWGKRVISTPVMPVGYILVGDFSEAGQVLRKGGLQVDMTNTNGTDFEQNLWTIRAEERVGLLVERPELFELVVLQNKP
jgi:HK97 family phage major capsid protein